MIKHKFGFKNLTRAQKHLIEKIKLFLFCKSKQVIGLWFTYVSYEISTFKTQCHMRACFENSQSCVLKIVFMHINFICIGLIIIPQKGGWRINSKIWNVTFRWSMFYSNWTACLPRHCWCAERAVFKSNNPCVARMWCVCVCVCVCVKCLQRSCYIQKINTFCSL